jgi:hypothetical protein
MVETPVNGGGNWARVKTAFVIKAANDSEKYIVDGFK